MFKGARLVAARNEKEIRGRGREKHRFTKEKRRGIKGTTTPTPLRAGRKSFKEFTVMTEKGGGERNGLKERGGEQSEEEEEEEERNEVEAKQI